jgi:hypothetical protein
MFFHEVFVSSAVRKTNNYPRAGDGTGFEGEFLLHLIRFVSNR